MARGVSKACKALWALEDILAALVSADTRTRIVVERITNRLKTIDEANDVHELQRARADIKAAKAELAGWHPSALKRK